METKRCIYTRPEGLCPGGTPLSDEHYLPRALGNLRGFEQLHDTICKDCNEHFSKLDEILVTRGPEAILRVAHEIKGRHKHRKRDVFHEYSQGYEPIVVNALLPNDESPTRLEIIFGEVGQPRREVTFEPNRVRKKDRFSFD